MPATWYDALVVDIITFSPTVKRFSLRLPPDAVPFHFTAGQFITMDLPVSEKRLNRWKSYSIANKPNSEGNDIIECCISLLDQGKGTAYLFHEVNVGDSIRLKGPDGAFTLSTEAHSNTTFVLICTGTGVAPFRSMIFDIFENKPADFHPKIHLIFGTKTLKQTIYKTEFEALALKYPHHFQYSIVLSKEADWEGYQGHVHQVYLSKYAQVNPAVKFYLCGWSNMIDDAVANLIKLGYERTQIKYELYG
ncbi:MAG: ferredoxin--NADP reductase [Saprospiraceae bacterium]|nr:ferredoxin--NADP reductase [Saprospiraceae bacterium]